MSRRLVVCSLMLSFCLLAASSAFSQGTRFRRTRIVNPVPGNPVASGNRLVRTLRRITTASATNPWLVKIEPGIYDVEDTTVSMLPFVDIEGSGEKHTTIIGSAPGVETLAGAHDSELREITIEHRGGSGWAIESNGDRFAMHRVTALSNGIAAIISNGDDAEMELVTARVDGTGNLTGILDWGDRSRWNGIHVTVVGTGIVYALFTYTDGNFTEIHAEAEGGSFAGAIRNEGGSPTMRNVFARAKATGIGQAITNGAGSNARLYDVVARAAGEERATGFSNEFGNPTLKNVDVKAEGGLDAFGIVTLFGASVTLHEVEVVATANGMGIALLTEGSTATVHGSTLQGDGFSIDHRFTGSSTSLIGTSQLIGAVRAGSGIVRCAVSYDGTYAPLGPNCLP